MNKKIYFLLILSCLIISCNQEKIIEQERTIERLNSQISLLEIENSNLENEINSLKETDQFYYQSGSDEFIKGNFEEAIDWMNRLKTRFPTSTLLSSADKLIRDSNTQITAIYERERTILNQLLREARNIDIEDAISKLDTYAGGSHPEDLKQTARQSLAAYREQFERERTARELEYKVGVRLVDYVTGWGDLNDFGSTLFVPQMMLRFKNISNHDLYAKFLSGDSSSKTIEITVRFLNTQNNEVFGDDTSYLINYDEPPLQPNYNKTIFINCGRGYRNGSIYMNLPSLEAHIYINGIFYKKYTIQKKLRGNL